MRNVATQEATYADAVSAQDDGFLAVLTNDDQAAIKNIRKWEHWNNCEFCDKKGQQSASQARYRTSGVKCAKADAMRAGWCRWHYRGSCQLLHPSSLRPGYLYTYDEARNGFTLTW